MRACERVMGRDRDASRFAPPLGDDTAGLRRDDEEMEDIPPEARRGGEDEVVEVRVEDDGEDEGGFGVGVGVGFGWVGSER